ncbi:MAG: nuclear transport factor 2 family protein [Gemmatimonadetes bacterium]|nr:nuclear transport factor 2 family protein [Gemmatimonadota bacterium]
MNRSLFPGLLLALGACARNPAPVMVASAGLENAQVRGVMDAALRAAAAGRPADSLYLVGATIVTDGVSGSAQARFAGVRPGGTATASAATIEITPYFAWGVLEYRWMAATGGQPAYGRATFVLERVGGSWRIKHVHTSSLRGAGRNGGGD